MDKARPTPRRLRCGIFGGKNLLRECKKSKPGAVQRVKVGVRLVCWNYGIHKEAPAQAEGGQELCVHGACRQAGSHLEKEPQVPRAASDPDLPLLVSCPWPWSWRLRFRVVRLFGA